MVGTPNASANDGVLTVADSHRRAAPVTPRGITRQRVVRAGGGVENPRDVGASRRRGVFVVIVVDTSVPAQVCFGSHIQTADRPLSPLTAAKAGEIMS